MKIKWLAHATFLIQAAGIKIVTDPYTPEVLGFPPIQEFADIVIRSSADDLGHCNAAMVNGSPLVLTATEWQGEIKTVHGLRVKSIPAQESLIHKEQPLDNAMYRFKLDGIDVAHMGDVGNRLSPTQVAALSGTDVLLAPAGGPPTINLKDLFEAIEVLRPRLIIPMHYHLPQTIVKMLPVTEFTRLFLPERVNWAERDEIELTSADLPEEPRILVLKPAVFRNQTS